MKRRPRVAPGDLLDPEKHTIDEVTAQFEAYKRHHEQEHQELTARLRNKFTLSSDMRQLNANMDSLRLDLQQLQSDLLDEKDGDAKESDPDSADRTKSSVTRERKSSSDPADLVISCGSSTCLFENCQRRVNSQVLLLHYLCDHGQQGGKPALSCQPLVEGERVVFPLEPQRCVLGVNRVIGILAYGGLLEEKFASSRRKRQIYNCFLPAEYAHLKSHVPVVALICRAPACGAIMDKKLASKAIVYEKKKKNFYIIWLVTPCDRLQLNATLWMCGREGDVRACSVVAVRKVSHSQDPAWFMPMDTNFWRIRFSEMKTLSNDFRDELSLEIGLTETNGASGERPR